MYLAMNRFRIAIGQEETFEEMWRQRDSYLDDVEGFQEFHLLKGPVGDDAALYVSHTEWASKESFVAWTESESFRKAHARAKAPEGVYLGPPQFEGFEVVL